MPRDSAERPFFSAFEIALPSERGFELDRPGTKEVILVLHDPVTISDDLIVGLRAGEDVQEEIFSIKRIEEEPVPAPSLQRGEEVSFSVLICRFQHTPVSEE